MIEGCFLHEECIVRMFCASDGCEGSRYVCMQPSLHPSPTTYLGCACVILTNPGGLGMVQKDIGIVLSIVGAMMLPVLFWLFPVVRTYVCMYVCMYV